MFTNNKISLIFIIMKDIKKITIALSPEIVKQLEGDNYNNH